MANSNQGGAKALWSKVQPGLRKTGDVFCSIGNVLRIIGKVLFHMRKLFMAIPVAMGSMYLANMCRQELGKAFRFHILDVLASWEEADLIIRQVEIAKPVAIFGPMIVTGVCLGLMFLSRRTMYPWLISIFSLLIPVFILFSNAYLPV